jgi:hypothetical protein
MRNLIPYLCTYRACGRAAKRARRRQKVYELLARFGIANGSVSERHGFSGSSLVLVSRAGAKPDTSKNTGKMSGCSRYARTNVNFVFYESIVSSEVSDVREHLRT